MVYIYDRVQGSEAFLSWDITSWEQFSLGKWYAEHCAMNQDDETPWETAHEWVQSHEWFETTLASERSASHKGIDAIESSGSDDSDEPDRDNPCACTRHDHDDGRCSGTNDGEGLKAR